MKILYYDNFLSGHHKDYLQALLRPNSNVMLPLNNELNNYIKITKKKYYHQINEISSIAKVHNIQILHFLSADVFLKYFGFKLEKLKNIKIIMTFHHIRITFLRKNAYRKIAKKIDYIIVHTKYCKKQLNQIGINNVIYIAYPKFNVLSENKDAKQYLGIVKDKPVIACIGGTREDKGLDILLEALQVVEQPFHLLIAGKEEDFSNRFIKAKISDYKEKATCILKFLSDEEFNICVNAADIICLPYKKTFNGASGPLTEGVWFRKTIIGPNHGSLGEIIKENELGYTFESENVRDLTRVINIALTREYKWSEKAERYRETLKTERFVEAYNNLYKKIINGEQR